MAERQVTDLHKPIAIGRDVEIYIAQAAQWIIGRKSAEGYDGASSGTGRCDCIENVRRPSRTTNRDHQIPWASVQLDLFCEYAIITKVIAEAGKHRAVVQG